MNILIILIKEFKQNLRNWKANIMMVLFPAVLIIILGAAFSNVFDNSIDLSGVKVLYTLQCSSQLADGFNSFTREMNNELGITFDETADMDSGMKSVKDTEYSCYILVTGNPDGIKFYKNARYDFEANLIESMTKTFAQRYDAYAEIYRANPAALGKIMADTSMDFVKTEALDKRKEPGSLDYYAITMLTLILMYSTLAGLFSVKQEQNLKTGNRILSSPVRKHEVFIGKILGCILITVVQAAVLIFFSRYILKADWGNDLATIFVLVLAEAVMAISIGMGISYIVKNEGTANALLNIIVPVIVFFAGCYFPLSVVGGPIVAISKVSPVKWLNDAIFRLIYNSDYSLVLPAVMINLGVAAVFITISALLSRKEAV